MKKFAVLDNQNTVVNVIIAENLAIAESSSNASCVEVLANVTAGINYTYNAQYSRFIEPKPFDSWILNQETFMNAPPVAYPTDGGIYSWNESLLEWVEV
jgi:hypothetical protein